MRRAGFLGIVGLAQEAETAKAANRFTITIAEHVLDLLFSPEAMQYDPILIASVVSLLDSGTFDVC